MKEKFTKPVVNVMKNIIIGDNDEKIEYRNDLFYFGDGQIIGGTTSGADDGEL